MDDYLQQPNQSRRADGLVNLSGRWFPNERRGVQPPSAAQILTTAVNAGIAYHTKYQEIYQIDVINLPAVISYAHSKL